MKFVRSVRKVHSLEATAVVYIHAYINIHTYTHTPFLPHPKPPSQAHDSSSAFLHTHAYIHTYTHTHRSFHGQSLHR